jgi:hypothetical protein
MTIARCRSAGTEGYPLSIYACTTHEPAVFAQDALSVGKSRHSEPSGEWPAQSNLSSFVDSEPARFPAFQVATSIFVSPASLDDDRSIPQAEVYQSRRVSSMDLWDAVH